MKKTAMRLQQWINLLTSWAKPWIVVGLIVLAMRYTGILSSISIVTNTALIKTGTMNIDPEKNAVGQKFNYNFVVYDLEGNKLDVKTLKGKVIFINMWATWCPPCRAEMPSIQSLYDKTDHDKIAFIMLSLDESKNKHKIINFIKDKGFSFPVYLPASQLPDQLIVPSIPTTFVVSADGRVKIKKVGTAQYDTETFKAFLDELISNDSVN